MSDIGVGQRMEKAMGALAARNHRKPWQALALAAVLVVAGGFFARNLSLSSDLVGLLPKSFPSVQDLEKLKKRFGGQGYLVVVGMNAEADKLKQFADDMAPKLGQLPEVRYVNYQRSDAFFEERVLYYAELEDLAGLQKQLDERITWEKQRANPLFVELEEAPPPSIDFSGFKQKLEQKLFLRRGSEQQAVAREPYYLDPEERMVVLMLKPKGNSADLSYAKKVVAQVDEFLKQQDLSKYGPGFQTALSGTYMKKIDHQSLITTDLARASSIALVLLVLYLAFHFRSPLGVLFTLLPVMGGLSWTYGFVGLFYGQVNLLTGFLGAVLGGLGVEHGIHLLGRYTALRSEGRDSLEAVREAFSHTGFSALISAVVAALTFLSLSISEFAAFHEFGIIAAVGMLVSISSYVLILPALLGLASKWGWTPREHVGSAGPMALLARWLPRSYRGVAIVVGVALVALISQAWSVSFNYDGSKLESLELPSVRLDRRMDKILGHSQSPVVVVTDSPAMEREVVRQLKERKAEKGKDSTIDFVRSQEELVPDKQAEKAAVLHAIHEKLEKLDPERLPKDLQANWQSYLKMTEAPVFQQKDLPEAMRRELEGYGTRRFTKEVRGMKLPDGTQVSAAGEALIVADILDMVAQEGPRILAAAILSVLLAMWVTLGKLRTALICMLPTLLSVAGLVGLMAILGIQFNYLNLVVLPVLVGTTVDAGVHLIQRLSEPDSDFISVYAETGRAITGGLLTSAIGFLALAIARHPGLNSIGNVANLGFGVNIVIVLLGFPALLLLVERWRRKHGTTAPAKEA
jgi:uncharacterized protein